MSPGREREKSTPDMGIIITRYLDARSSEGALIKFIIESLQLVRTICTADTSFPELTPWNVIDFGGEEVMRQCGLYTMFMQCWRTGGRGGGRYDDEVVEEDFERAVWERERLASCCDSDLFYVGCEVEECI